MSGVFTSIYTPNIPEPWCETSRMRIKAAYLPLMSEESAQACQILNQESGRPNKHLANSLMYMSNLPQSKSSTVRAAVL